jgi:hypothetical protein
MDFKFSIDSNITLADKDHKKRGRIPKYDFPFENMKIGDSFLVSQNTKTIQSYLITRANRFCNIKELNWKFSTRKTTDGYRVFRVK